MSALDTRRNRPERPTRPAAPPLPDIDALDRTHAQVLGTLGDLQRLIQHLEEDGIDAQARADAQMVCRFFAETAREHHAQEERAVFPALLRRGDPALVQHVRRLQQDHGWLEEDWIELEPQLQAVAGGYSWYDLDTLRHAVEVFTALYEEHIALEESVIYPAARQLMADEQASAQRRQAQSAG